MFSRIVSEEKTAQLLDLPAGPALRKSLSAAGIKPVKSKGKTGHYRIGDIVVFKLTQIINHIGVDAEKAAYTPKQF